MGLWGNWMLSENITALEEHKAELEKDAVANAEEIAKIDARIAELTKEDKE